MNRQTVCNKKLLGDASTPPGDGLGAGCKFCSLCMHECDGLVTYLH